MFPGTNFLSLLFQSRQRLCTARRGEHLAGGREQMRLICAHPLPGCSWKLDAWDAFSPFPFGGWGPGRVGSGSRLWAALECYPSSHAMWLRCCHGGSPRQAGQLFQRRGNDPLHLVSQGAAGPSLWLSNYTHYIANSFWAC